MQKNAAETLRHLTNPERIMLPIYSLAIVAMSFIFTQTLGAQTLNERLDEMMQAELVANEPGAVALVAKDGKIIYQNAIGMANLELDVPLTTESVLQIGSITKQFTAVAILMLQAEGKLDINDDITVYIPDYPTAGNKITIKHLLTHTSGIKSYTGMQSWQEIWRQDLTPLELIEVFKDEEMDFAPGENFSYSNSGYILLGYVIEVASGESYADFIESKIFEPLGMQYSSYGSRSELVKNRASGYQFDGANFVNAEYLSLTQPYAAGSIMSTVGDLLIWNQAVMNGKLIEREVLQQAFIDYKTNSGETTGYGFGWMVDEVNGSPTIEHSGGIFGFSSYGIYLPEQDVYAVVLANTRTGAAGNISLKMAALVAGVPFPDKSDIVDIAPDALRKFEGLYEFEDGSERLIRYKDGGLTSSRGGGKIKIFHIGDNRFFYENRPAQIQFIDGETGTEAVFTRRTHKTTGRLTGMAPPEKVAIMVDDSILERYVGVFNLMPGFDITFTVDDGQLITQATGQGKVPLDAESETLFYVTQLGAEFKFHVDDDGICNRFVLVQGGQTIEGKRVK